ncbi:MAG: hypothetical protein ABIH37_04830 [archaeon]
MSKSTLEIINSGKYLESVSSIVKNKSKEGQIIYITTNRLVKNLIKHFKESKIQVDKILFIDCISKRVGKIDEEIKNCLFLESSRSLTSIGLAITQCIKNLSGKKIVILDSLSTLLIYNDENTTGRFSNFLINKMKYKEVDFVIFALKIDLDRKIIKHIVSCSDEVKEW